MVSASQKATVKRAPWLALLVGLAAAASMGLVGSAASGQAGNAASGQISAGQVQGDYQPPAEAVAGEPAAYTPGQLDELVAPIALYPDDLLAIVLPASTYPLQIVEAARFLEDVKKDSSLKPNEDWDDSVVALLNYPDVVALMNDDLDWTWRLGDAVINQQADVIDAVSRFRDRAYAAGNLKSDDHQVVTAENDVIEIRPADPEVIYVPYYEPTEVIVYQPVPVYHYYPRPYPVYYYPYPLGYSFWGGYFWGVTTFFNIGWHSHYLHFHHHHHYRHPYYGHHYYHRKRHYDGHYYGHYYRTRDRHSSYWASDGRRRHVSREGYAASNVWRPSERHGARPGKRHARSSGDRRAANLAPADLTRDGRLDRRARETVRGEPSLRQELAARTQPRRDRELNARDRQATRNIHQRTQQRTEDRLDALNRQSQRRGEPTLQRRPDRSENADRVDRTRKVDSATIRSALRATERAEQGRTIVRPAQRGTVRSNDDRGSQRATPVMRSTTPSHVARGGDRAEQVRSAAPSAQRGAVRHQGSGSDRGQQLNRGTTIHSAAGNNRAPQVRSIPPSASRETARPTGRSSQPSIVRSERSHSPAMGQRSSGSQHASPPSRPAQSSQASRPKASAERRSDNRQSGSRENSRNTRRR